jgi:hypothetical protein
LKLDKIIQQRDGRWVIVDLAGREAAYVPSPAFLGESVRGYAQSIFEVVESV